MPNRIPYARTAPKQARTEDKAERDAFYGGKRWRSLRADHLASFPLCVSCLAQGIVTAATIVHHVLERLAAPELAYEPCNLESACDACHTAEHERRRKGGAGHKSATPTPPAGL